MVRLHSPSCSAGRRKLNSEFLSQFSSKVLSLTTDYWITCDLYITVKSVNGWSRVVRSCQLAQLEAGSQDKDMSAWNPVTEGSSICSCAWLFLWSAGNGYGCFISAIGPLAGQGETKGIAHMKSFLILGIAFLCNLVALFSYIIICQPCIRLLWLP